MPAGREDTTPVDIAVGTDETIEVVTTVPAEIAGRVEAPLPVALSAGMNVIGNVWIVAIFEPKCTIRSKRGRSLEGRSNVGLGDEGAERCFDAKDAGFYPLSALASERWPGTAVRERGRRGESLDHLG